LVEASSSGDAERPAAERLAQPPPAFYALAPGAWRDYVTLLHAPYTAWHLSYVAIGAALAPALDGRRLAAALLAFFLAVGIAAHCLDELRGRPLRTRVPSGVLIALAVASLAGAVAIGLYGATVVGAGFGVLVVLGALAVPAYNLEWFGGRAHDDIAFALAWGAFPVLASYYAQAGRLGIAAVLGAAFAVAASLAQRRLSTWSRRLRRDVVVLEGAVEWGSGEVERLDAARLAAASDGALRLLAVAMCLLATALVVARLA
jgi:hypothetical protein